MWITLVFYSIILSIVIILAAKYLVVKKIIALPLKLEEYKSCEDRFWKIKWLFIFAAIFFIILSLFYIELQFLLLLLALILGMGGIIIVDALFSVCPNCGKIVSFPMRGLSKSARIILENKNCSYCDFTFWK
jgi:hypothetical protein